MALTLSATILNWSEVLMLKNPSHFSGGTLISADVEDLAPPIMAIMELNSCQCQYADYKCINIKLDGSCKSSTNDFNLR